MNWPKQDMSHLKMPDGWEKLPRYTHVEFMMDFPDPNKVAIQRMLLVPPNSEYLTLKEGDVVDYEKGNGWSQVNKSMPQSGTAKVVNVKWIYGDLDKVIICLESIT